jgi:hypothetical protein
MKKAENKNGFVLVEVLISAFLTGLTLAGILSLLAWTGYATSVSGQQTVATTLAQEKMEELMSSDFNLLFSGSDVSDPFTRSWQVTPAGMEYQKKIEVLVSWEDLRGRMHTLTNKSFCVEEKLITDGLSFNTLFNSP